MAGTEEGGEGGGGREAGGGGGGRRGREGYLRNSVAKKERPTKENAPDSVESWGVSLNNPLPEICSQSA